MLKGGRFENAGNQYNGLWRGATLESFDQSANKATRETLRSRARYTVANNAFAANAAKTVAGAVVGTCPRLQLTSTKVSPDKLAQIENDFNSWAAEIGLAEKLRQMVYARFVDGEAFAQFCLNKRLANAVKLDLFLFDAERVTGQPFGVNKNIWTDGITLSNVGTPVSYRVLKNHPSESFDSEAVEVPANRIAHLYRRQFPEQHRGVTELQPALDLFLLLDRYTKAAVIAAETAADIAVVFHTDNYADFGAQSSPSNGKPFAEMGWRKGTTVTLPEGWQASQIKAEQPTGTYNTFVSAVLNQIGAAVGVPKILLQNSAENSNYSSARLDLQSFNASIKVDREQLINTVLAPLFKYWLNLYATAKGTAFEVSARFYFDQFVTIDPQKEADAAATRLASNTSNLSLEFARVGLDWEEQVKQRARELDLIEKLGLTRGNDGKQT